MLNLDEAVLALGRLYRREILVFNDDADWNKANRHQAYRQYILWTHGRLGAGDRRVIPSCSVWRIRDKNPYHFGQYTGFPACRIGLKGQYFRVFFDGLFSFTLKSYRYSNCCIFFISQHIKI